MCQTEGERQEVFDLFIVATMLEHSVGKIYTMDKEQFNVTEIQVESPVP